MADTRQPTELVQGTLDMLILRVLALEPMHGYGIGVRLEQISRGTFRVNAGSLFPAFRRLERDRLVAADWQTTQNGTAREVLPLDGAGQGGAEASHGGLGAPG